MNPLANSQLEELDKFVANIQGERPITFPIVKRKDEAAHGEYRTKRLILEIYDALAVAAASGKPYVSPLKPPKRATERP